MKRNADKLPQRIPTVAPCAQCGAVLASGITCADRFDALLALDHSRQQPWGSRHGLAFCVYTLQHPDGHTPSEIYRYWSFLQRVYTYGSSPGDVAQQIRAVGGKTPEFWDVAPLRGAVDPPREFAVTIADLGDFEAETYAGKLDDWCRATIAAWDAMR